MGIGTHWPWPRISEDFCRAEIAPGVWRCPVPYRASGHPSTAHMARSVREVIRGNHAKAARVERRLGRELSADEYAEMFYGC